MLLSFATCLVAYPKYIETKTTIEIKETVAQQLDCMAKNIYYEARGESFESKIAVGQVTLNRTKNPNFPSDICEVVYQKTGKTCQFSWNCQDVKAIENGFAWEESKIVAKYILTNQLSHDKIKDALFYHATYVTTNWDKQYDRIGKIGNHVFYKLKGA